MCFAKLCLQNISLLYRSPLVRRIISIKWTCTRRPHYRLPHRRQRHLPLPLQPPRTTTIPTNLAFKLHSKVTSPIQQATSRRRSHCRHRSRCGPPRLRRAHLKRYHLLPLKHTTWIATTTVLVTRRAPSYERCKTEGIHRPRQPQADASGATKRHLDDPPPLQLFAHPLASTNKETTI